MLLNILTCHQRKLCTKEMGIAMKALKGELEQIQSAKLGFPTKEKRNQTLTDADEYGTVHIINYSFYIEEFP